MSPKVGGIISTGYSPVLMIIQLIEPAYRIKLNVNTLFRAQLYICLLYKINQPYKIPPETCNYFK